MRTSKYNAEGYPDPTAKAAIDNASRKKRYVPTESEEQILLFDWAARNEKKYPDLKWLFHIPNGGLRNKVTAARLKREGAKPGVPDICLSVPSRGYHGLYIELKRTAGSRISDNQTEWLNELKMQDYFAVVAYGCEKARDYIEWYLGGGHDVCQ